MSTVNGGPLNIITTGLVLYLDAANPNSYSGSGTIWTDLSGNNSNGTLTNGPTFNNTNVGSIVFDGVNDYISWPDNPLSSLSSITFDAWFKLPANPGDFFLVSGNTLQLYLQANTAWYINGIPGQKSFTWSTFNTNWNNIVFTYDSLGTASVYINNIPITISLISGNISSQQNLQLGGRSFTNYMNGNISNVKIYNRALSSTEILQNYNALRISRF